MVTSGKVQEWKGKEAKDQTGNYCHHFQKLMETNLSVKLFMQTIEIV